MSEIFKKIETFADAKVSLRLCINSKLLVKRGYKRSRKFLRHNMCERVKESFNIQLQASDFLAISYDTGVLLIEKSCLLDILE